MSSDFKSLFLSNKLVKFLFSYGRRRVIKPGEIFIKEGDDSHNCFVLLIGEADILKEDENGEQTTVGRIQQGSIIGEMGVFLQEKRSTSVQAVGELLLLEFTAPRFYQAVEDIPELAIRLIKSLAEKLNAANKHAVDLQAQGHLSEYVDFRDSSTSADTTSTN